MSNIDVTNTITTSLRIAIEQLDNDAAIPELSQDLREQFRRQAIESREVLAAIEFDTVRIAGTIPAISDRSLQLLLAYARDIPNCSGRAPVGGNAGGSKEDRGNLTQLKRAGLITTDTDEDNRVWLRFTDSGREMAARHGAVINE